MAQKAHHHPPSAETAQQLAAQQPVVMPQIREALIQGRDQNPGPVKDPTLKSWEDRDGNGIRDTEERVFLEARAQTAQIERPLTLEDLRHPRPSEPAWAHDVPAMRDIQTAAYALVALGIENAEHLLNGGRQGRPFAGATGLGGLAA